MQFCYPNMVLKNSGCKGYNAVFLVWRSGFTFESVDMVCLTHVISVGDKNFRSTTKLTVHDFVIIK